MARNEVEQYVLVREEERGFAALIHLLNAVPLWGVVFITVIWIYFRERSRELIFHAQQAMVFHIVSLVILLVWLIIGMITLPVRVLSENVASVIETANLAVLIVCLSIYGVVCLAGVGLTLAGRPFLYPVLGRRVLRGSVRKTSTEE
ncbi:DUF4870 domain-containing protein [bacterium]|nr:DUF4870 domain-containing protein [bacterium]